MQILNLILLVQLGIIFKACLRAVLLPIFRILPHQIKQKKDGHMRINETRFIRRREYNQGRRIVMTDIWRCELVVFLSREGIATQNWGSRRRLF
jgi:hypothetical protein